MRLFDPPLALQRQEWLLQVLRSCNADSILELGCAEAPLTFCIAAIAPAPFLPCPDWLRNHLLARFSFLSVSDFVEPGQVSPSNLIALDKDEAVLQCPVRDLTRVAGRTNTEPRFKGMRVRVLQGRLEQYDERLCDLDAIVASEVIEHLDEDTLEAFNQLILGRYRPKRLLVTTPNYAFNRKFALVTDGRAVDAGLFRDPTGRTDRCFRHDDHQFEFTPVEFEAWCRRLAAQQGYEVEIDGVGVCTWQQQQLSNEEDDDAKYASQTALFLRHETTSKDGDEKKQAPDPPQQPLRVLLDRTLLPSVSDCETKCPEEIRALTLDVMILLSKQQPQVDNDRSSPETLEFDCWRIWMDRALRVACAGRLDCWLLSLGVVSNCGKEGQTEDARLYKSDDYLLFELAERDGQLYLRVTGSNHLPSKCQEAIGSIEKKPRNKLSRMCSWE